MRKVNSLHYFLVVHSFRRLRTLHLLSSALGRRERGLAARCKRLSLVVPSPSPCRRVVNSARGRLRFQFHNARPRCHLPVSSGNPVYVIQCVFLFRHSPGEVAKVLLSFSLPFSILKRDIDLKLRRNEASVLWST